MEHTQRRSRCQPEIDVQVVLSSLSMIGDALWGCRTGLAREGAQGAEG
jgi:hypothetical protein